MPPDQPPDPPTPPEPVQFHGCATLLLAWVAFANAVAVLAFPLLPEAMIRDGLPYYEPWMFIPFAAASAVNIWCVFAMFRFRMWGFYGLWAVAAGSTLLSLAAGASYPRAASGFVGLVVLYWLLQIGGKRSAWTRLSDPTIAAAPAAGAGASTVPPPAPAATERSDRPAAAPRATQLVGQACAVCAAHIGSVLDAHFCPACGNPVHAACATATTRPESACAGCGAPAAVVRARVEPAVEPAGAPDPAVLRYVFGVLLFGAFVVFVTPSEMAVVVSQAGGAGDPGGLLQFGVCVALLFGPTGYLTFPRPWRLRAVAWLSLACLGYSLFLFGFLAFSKANPQTVPSPDQRFFLQSVTIHYVPLAAISAVKLAVWAALFRKRFG